MKNKLPLSELVARSSAFEPYLNTVAIAIMATLFLFWDLSRAMFVLLSLAALGYLVVYRPQLPGDHRLYSWPIIAYVGATFLSLWVNGFSDSGINRFVSRYMLLLIAIPLVSMYFLSFDSKRNPWIKYAAGCLALGALALFDSLFSDHYRAGGGDLNPSAFGFLALAMTSIVLAGYHRFSQTRLGKVVYFLSILMGICAILLSGTRTSWLAAVVVFGIAIFVMLDRYSILRRVMIALILVGAVGIVGSSIPLVQKRFDNMIEIVTPYLTGEEQTRWNNLRKRVEVWKAAWYMGLENRYFGFGPGNTKKEIKLYAEQNRGLRPIRKMNHIHNQFLQTFAMTGVIGLVSLLALFICHFWIFIKYLGRQYDPMVRSLALSGFLLLVAYLIKSFPGVPLYGKQYLMMYGFASATIWGCLLGALRESGAEDQQ